MYNAPIRLVTMLDQGAVFVRPPYGDSGHTCRRGNDHRNRRRGPNLILTQAHRTTLQPTPATRRPRAVRVAVAVATAANNGHPMDQ